MNPNLIVNTAIANPLNWLSSATMHSLGWALLHFLWQGTAIAALAAVAMSLVRRPSVRYLAGLAALALMLVSPVATFFYSQQRSDDVTKSSPLAAAASPIARGNTAASGATSVDPVSRSKDAFPWLVEAWLVGVALLSLRSAGGLLVLERERRRRCAIVADRVLAVCYDLQDQLGIDRAVQYCESAYLQAPAVIGWFRPVVLLPISTLTGLTDEQLRMVIAHELAHIRRLDALVNMFQVCAETLLFYHPAVWWMNKRIRAERELCCDEVAVSVCGDVVEYARVLTMMEEWRSAPALAMGANRGSLSERIAHLLRLRSSREGSRKLGVLGSIVFLTTAIVAGNALFGIAFSKPIVHANSSAVSHLLPKLAALQAQAASPAAAKPATKPSPAQSPSSSPSDDRPVSGQSYIDGMKSAGMGDLSADDLIALKVQDVTPEYIREMRELGLHVDTDGIVGMKVQGVTPEYVKELRSMGFNPDVDEIIGMKVQGITPEYVNGMKQAGIKPDADNIIGMKVQGVTPEYVRELQALGFKVDADSIIGMKVQGVTPEYIQSIRALGLSPSADDFVGMKVQGVTADYIKTLQSAGFKPSVDDVIEAKVQGVTPEFIDLALKHGFQNLTIDKLVQLKRLGILESKGEI